MVRMSEILKRAKQEEALVKPEPIKIKKEQEREERPLLPSRREKKEEKISPGVEVSRVVMESAKLEKVSAEDLYQQALDMVKGILDKAAKDETIKADEIREMVEKLMDRIALGAEELIWFVTKSTPDNYLYAHLVNVCILSIEIGLEVGYNKSKLSELGIAALLHDVGMIKVISIAQQSRGLRTEEYTEIKKHPLQGAEILERVRGLSTQAISVVQQQHERMNGKGYPRGLKSGEINEYAQIVAIVDVYEAMTHERPYRKRMLPYEALRGILASKDLFNLKMLKILLNKISVYPIGSWVELNTGEIGRVVKIDSNAPLRPTVNIIFNREEKRLEEAKSVNLTMHITLYIKRPLDESEIKDKIEK